MYSFWQFSVILFFSRSIQLFIHSIHWVIHPLIHILFFNGTMAQCRQLQELYCSSPCNVQFLFLLPLRLLEPPALESLHNLAASFFISYYTSAGQSQLHNTSNTSPALFILFFIPFFYTLLPSSAPPRCLEKHFGSSG